MHKLRIQGGRPLEGVIPIAGAKNAALPALAATLLTSEPVTLDRIPSVVDIRTMIGLLESIGATVRRENGRTFIHTASIESPEAPYELVKTMRASSLVLGPLVARAGRARVSMPGGCAIGARPINLHVSGLEVLGATIHQEAGYVEAIAENGLRGAHYVFPRITVTGTEDLMMAATLAEGETVLENAAREPEVADLAALLNRMGAKISGAGESRIVIQGVSALHGAEHAIIPDRIETGSYLVAGALTADELLLTGADPSHLSAVLEKLLQAGVEIEEPSPGSLRVRKAKRLRPVDVTTEEHPGFPTDMQAQWMALMAFADGVSHVTETIFENRFMHVAELLRMGAEIELAGNRATIRGKESLSGAAVMASDLRASACLVLTALAAQGDTVIDRVYHLDRGYERMDEKLRAVGAHIERLS
ncbi:MAG: UDP-N-acetylglucosamine 1-carboxyvinyltransferase [Bryobacterales bacterium]|nr:UDP-N-acetylglucosamine 1-carboxyvinyltransferase [Acidobacteriota bacterium]MCB9384668.1 UDP-N-acetylglucosamine 1-carboxyvinyltransferase [Bryobacterales bacterium]